MMLRNVAFAFAVFLSFMLSAHAQTWTPLTHQPPFNAGTALLLTDGTVMVQEISVGLKGTGHWWKLTPDNTGSYVNGTWSQLADMPAGYAPLYYASAVLPDGRVVVEGGEYNNSPQEYTTRGAIYDPATDTWTSITPPNGVTKIGDASSVVLADGTFMLGTCCPPTTDWLLNASSLTWTATGASKADDNSEEGWTLLPNGYVLTVDTQIDTNSEVYDPSTGNWSSAGSTIALLSATDPNSGFVPEIGPAVLMPDGRVFATGATSNTAIYNSLNGSWSVGPVFPSGLDIADGPAALLPNGHVLVDSSPGFFNSPSSFFEFDGANLVPVANPPNASTTPSFIGSMLVLPTGQILFTNQSAQVEIYTAAGTYQNAWQPTVTSVAQALNAGSVNNSISGTQFNGLSQGAMYGDDAQAATNYPLVRIINNATSHVSYAKTHNHSTMAVATGPLAVSTQFDVPANIETGHSTLQVVANGIPSNPVAILVAPPAPVYAGFLEHTGCDTISGWAADRTRLSTAITANIYNNGTLLITVEANILRSDVGAYLGDNGLHGFSIITPASLVDGNAHQLSVRFENSGTELSGSPVSLTCAPRNYTGYLDHPGCDTISGWAADRNRLNTSITAGIYNNGILLTTVQANISRPDVGAYLGDNGLHGFSITTPASLADGTAHQLSVKFENSGTELPASPVSLTCAPRNYTGYLDHPGCNTISGWAADRSRLNTSITASIYDNGVLVTTVPANISRPDVGASLGDNGLHGFSITTPARFLDGHTHQLDVRPENSSTEIGASPASLTCSGP
jgi:hypothetical protein